MSLALAFVTGAVAATLALTFLLRTRMIEATPSPLASVEETVAALEAGIAAADGWSSPGTRDINGMLAKNGVSFTPKVRLVEMCKARYAAQILADARPMATLLPCALAVYEDNTGKVWISRLNSGLLARFFGGTVARVMGGGVAVEEARLLASLRR